MVWGVVAVVALIVFAAGYLASEDIVDAYRRYEGWVVDEVKTQTRFHHWRVSRAHAVRLLRLLLGTAFLLGSILALSPVGGIMIAMMVGFVPVPLVRYFKSHRWKTFDEQLLDGVNLLRNAMKSGLGLQQAIEVLVREMRPPISEEFDLVLKEVQLGRTMDEALISLNERMEHPELDLVVSSVVTLRRTGGNISETFELISHTIEERVRVEGKIRALTAQGMTQAYVLVSMPFVLGIIMFLMDPGYMRPMFSTVLGNLLLLLVGLMVFIGWNVIKRVVTIEV